MNILENILIALNALKGNRLRSVLALLGIVIGVFAVTTMISLGEMATAGISREVESMIGRSLYCYVKGPNALDKWSFDDTDLKTLAPLPAQVIPYNYTGAEFEPKPGERKSINLTGSFGDLPQRTSSIQLAKGRYFTESESRAGLGLAVISQGLAKEWYGEHDPIGQRKQVIFGGRKVEVAVIGVLQPEVMNIGGPSYSMSLPLPFLWRTHPYMRRNTFSGIEIAAGRDINMADLETSTNRLFKNRYGKKAEVVVQSGERLGTQIKSITGIMQALLGAIGGLSLLVGGIGIMNIMLVSVTERTREIGLRKALGATPAQISQQFLIEAVVLTVIGGILGVVLSAGVLWLIMKLVPFFKYYILNLSTVLISLGMSALLGLFFGVWPAARAAGLDPIEALSYE